MNPIDYKFVMMLSNRLERFSVKSTSPLKINCRCILCGDSQKSKSKARGWITEYQGSARFGCFNCGESVWLKDLLQRVDPNLADEYIIEGKLEWMANNGIVATKVEADKPEFKVIKDPLNGLKKISQLAHDHPVKQYVEKRKIPTNQHYRVFYAPKFNKFINGMIPDKLNTERDEPRLVLPLFNANKQVIGFQGRSFKKDGLRYITIMIRDEPKAFGMEQVDMSKQNICVEGPIDSLFLDNCWAMVGADVSLGNENTVYVHDNEPRNAEIVKRIERNINKGQKVVIWPDKMKNYGKDVNDYILNGLTSSQIERIIKANTFDGLMANLKLTEWRKC